MSDSELLFMGTLACEGIKSHISARFLRKKLSTRLIPFFNTFFNTFLDIYTRALKVTFLRLFWRFWVTFLRRLGNFFTVSKLYLLTFKVTDLQNSYF